MSQLLLKIVKIAIIELLPIISEILTKKISEHEQKKEIN
jgi:hypothetical protein